MKIPTRIIRLIFLGAVLLLLLLLMPEAGAAGIPSVPSGSTYTTVVDTPAFSIPFVVYPNGLYYSFGVNIGIHAGATKGIDKSLGEVEYPPFPPGGAYTMCVNDWTNSILDLRPYISAAQIDTFEIGLAPDADSYPIVFTWPDLHPYYSGSVRLRTTLTPGKGITIDMKAQTSYTLTSGPYISPDSPPPFWATLTVYVVAEGPISGTSMPVVSTYGLGNGGFQAIVNAPTGTTTSSKSGYGIAAGTTNVWFEYGPTTSYGTSTSPQTIAAGTSANVSLAFDPATLPVNTRIHFRSVAQNALGTFYGGDRLASNGNPPPELYDSSGIVLYRTATYRDWADAKDTKGKRKSLKAQPDKIDFSVGVQCKSDGISDLTLLFGSVIDTAVTGSPLTATHGAVATTTDPKLKVWHLHWSSSLTNGETINITGFSWGGKTFKVAGYMWGSPAGKMEKTYTSTITPRLPMPNLNNVGEGIFGGTKQTPVVITVGANSDPKGAHTVYHLKYADVLKSLVKERGKDAALYHTKAARWLSSFDKNGKAISKKQKSLPPDKHDNILFAEALTLKLNVAASDAGIFPKGLGDLLYKNSTPFDGATVREITAKVDSFLGGVNRTSGTNDTTGSAIYLKVAQDINTSFAGPMDTTSWSGGKVVCKGVKMLLNVSCLSFVHSAIPSAAFASAQLLERSTKPLGFRLEQNYPNPFNPTTTINYQLPVDSKVRLTVFNLLGQLVATIIAGQQQAGEQSVTWDAGNFSSGVYFYRLEATSIADPAKQFSQTHKMLLVK